MILSLMMLREHPENADVFFCFSPIHSEGPIVDTHFSPPKTARIRHRKKQMKTEADLAGISDEKYKWL